jgi:hypothetical protein
MVIRLFAADWAFQPQTPALKRFNRCLSPEAAEEEQKRRNLMD